MTQQDYNSLIGPLNSDTAWPMYSFERPAYAFWNGLATALHQRGWSDEEIREWLQSKEPRYLLNEGTVPEALEAMGALMALSAQRP